MMDALSIVSHIYFTVHGDNEHRSLENYTKTKTLSSKTKVKAAIKFIVKQHSYECPAVSAFPIDFVHEDFQRWINEQTKN